MIDPFASLPQSAREVIGRRRSQPDQPLEVWAGLPRSAQLETLGAPDVDIELARQQERLLGPTGLRTIAGARGAQGDPILGEEEPAPRQGLLEILSDYALRPQSAVTGFVTGLAGMDRLRQTRDGRGVSDGALFDEPVREQGGLQLAQERFWKGIRGEEKYQAADFGVLAYDREEAGLGERFMKSAAGFVLDVAIDPITYASFGASILGRRMGAVAVNSQARKNMEGLISKLDDATLADNIRDAVVRGGTDESVLTAQLRRTMSDAGIPADGLVDINRALEIMSGSPEMLRAVAADSIAYTSAAMYRAFGAGGTRAYLIKNFGEAGRELWRTLPADLRGGVRIRVPFSASYNRAAGRGSVPTAIPLVPWETGVVSDALALSGFSNGVRQFMRERMLLRPLGDNLSGITGATDRATASLVYRRNSDTAGKWFGRKDPAVDPKLRVTSWASSQMLETELSGLRHRIMTSMAKDGPELQMASKAYRAGRDAAGDEFDEVFDRLIRSDLWSDGTEAQSLEQVLGLAGRKPTELELQAYEAATGYQKILRGIGNDLSLLESQYAGFAPRLLEDYWPRIVDDMEQAMSGRGIGGFSNLKERKHFVAEWNPDGSVKRWMTPREIAQQLGSPKFVENAEAAMSAYIISMRRFIEEERFFQTMLDRGVLFKGGRQAMSDAIPDLTAASGLWVDTWNRVSGTAARLGAIGRGEGTPERTLTARAAALNGRQLDDVVSEAMDLGTAIQAGRVYGPQVQGNYLESLNAAGRRVWNSGDNVTIEQTANNTYAVSRRVNGEQQWLSPTRNEQTGRVAARWSKKEPKESFVSFEEARSFADSNMATERKREFVRRMEDLRAEFMARYVKMTQLRNGMKDADLSPFHPGNVPLARQGEYFEQLTEAIDLFGDAVGLVGRERRALTYRNEAWGAGRGAAFSPVSASTNGPKMRKFWQDRMDRMNIFGPESIVDDVKRLFRAVDNPEGFKKWVDEYYRPFYALQKALMTSQRGPGYVLRNIQGGMWNAYLIGTTGKHFATAGTVKTFEVQARAAARRQAPNDVRQQGEIAQREFRAMLKRKYGDRRAKELYDTWEFFEMRGLRGREAASQTVGTQATARVTGDAMGDIYRVIPDADQNAVERAVGWGTSHWWARTMGDAAQGSEDYLRFAAFLRGADMYGLDDGGRAASLMVKATQFDYADLSRFEAEFVKMIIPFYTWTRNNVPLQMRAIIAEPGKILKAIRVNDALADAFGDPDDPEEPLPGYVRERFGWRVRKDILVGPEDDAISAGMVFGEPLIDINRLFGTPTQPGGWGLSSVLNWREVANNTAPWIKAAAPTFTSMELSTGGRLPREEEAPRWAAALGLGRTTPDGERVMNARALRAVRDIVTPLGLAERYAPQLLGNERLQRRWYTTLGSAILGLPVSTLDPYQTAAELRQQEQRLRGQLVRNMGEDYSQATAYVREALLLGATPQELQFIRDGLLGGRDVGDVPVEELDVWAMRDTITFLRRVQELKDRGVSQESLDRMVAYFRPRTDMEMGVRAGGVQPLTADELAELNETPESVARMSDEERAQLLVLYMERNPDWRPRR